MPQQQQSSRIGDMHLSRALSVVIQRDGDVVVLITQGGMPIGGADIGNQEDQVAQVEFCLSGGRSPHTRKALLALLVAIKEDNEKNPIQES